jgi:uncharacterized protein (TIGR02145 family)
MKTNLFRKNHSSSKGGMRIMRLVLLLLPFLGRGLGGGGMLFAQNGVTVSNLAVDAGTVTFNVSWETPMPVELWSDTVWVFVDYNDAGVMKRLPLSPGATLTATSAPGTGTVIEEPGNNQGVWVAGNARDAGAFSATVKLLTATANLAGACVYGSNYPPVGEYNDDATEISFTGTPMYEIALDRSGGGTATVKSGDMFLLPCDYTVTSFSDATGAPGRLNGIPFNGSVPQYAASTKTWTVGSQIWSDVINAPECDHNAFTNSDTDPYCRSYTINGIKWYYYNWPYVNKNQNTLCPSPWRVPTSEDFITLDKAFGGSGENRSEVASSWITEHYIDAWGAAFNGWHVGSASSGQGSALDYYSSSQATDSAGIYLEVYKNGAVRPNMVYGKGLGINVRCVR